MTSRSWNKTTRDPHPSYHQCIPERHGRRAAGVGLYTDPAQADCGAPQGDDHGVHHVLRVSGLLSHLPRAGWVGTLPEDGDDSHGVLVDTRDAYGAGRYGAGAGDHHVAARAGGAIRQASETGTVGAAGLAVRQCARWGGVRDAVSRVDTAGSGWLL